MSQSLSYKQLLSALLREEGSSVVKKVRSILKRIEMNQNRIEQTMGVVATVHDNLHSKAAPHSKSADTHTKHRPK